jgi:hypothetical protein
MSDEPFWAGDYHLNYNYQAPWWGAYSSNHIELTEPYDAPLKAFIPRGRRNAKKFLDCRGVYYEVGIGPKGLAVATELFHGQKSNAAYAAVNMVMRYEHTRDPAYLRDGAYPFLREVADFWEDYLKFEGGRYVIYRDAIHETTEDHDDFNCLLSLGLLRMVFGALLRWSATLKLDGDRRPKWTHILRHLSQFPTFERMGKTIFRLTERGMEWNDSNSLAIQHIWPAGAIGLGSDPLLLEISRNTVDALRRWHCVPTFYTAAARVGFHPAEVLAQLEKRCQQHSFPNLLACEGGGAIEACGGVTSAVNEMLLQSHEGVLRLFPAWPREKNARFETLRAVGAFLVSSELRDGAVQFVRISSERGEDCVVQNPWPGRTVAVLRDGRVAETAAGPIFTFATAKSQRLELRPAAAPRAQVAP